MIIYLIKYFQILVICDLPIGLLIVGSTYKKWYDLLALFIPMGFIFLIKRL